MIAFQTISDMRNDIAQCALSITEIAIKHGVSTATVSTHCQDMKVMLPRKKHVRKAPLFEGKALEVLAAIHNGDERTNAELGRQFACTREFVRQVRNWMKNNLRGNK